MRHNDNITILTMLLFSILFFNCKKETHLVEKEVTEEKTILNEENSLFSTRYIDRLLEIPYEKYQQIDPTRFRKEFGDQEGNITLYDFYEFIPNQGSQTYLGIYFDKEAGRFVSHLQVGFFAGIDTLKEVYCIKFTKAFRDCRLSFILSPYPNMTPEIIYLRSRNDKLFYLKHPDAEMPMFFGHGHIESEEFLKSAKEAYKLYKLEKNTPPLTDFGFAQEEVRKLEELLGQD
ncbi:MAG: hypothetical protein ACO1NV_05825 [Leptospira bouyouniensis]|uniref:Lipoprotein n=1 Tax=Leptospira bouyouniensis TaxID=2484911 RepID=A0ABY2LDF7_9LEPT|nr:hypothetical protein [Leptospira bouyouniensis]TGK54196.1 hypothetical protein EHQ10_00040 [Leptospira bouyouniensis]